ncbi:sugar phosphate isomerase/epimerase family protein [Streptomyces sp. NPDC047000]|uniref:sugar phosphate isomerase/epimerase family protein n=1 Tax=Streptomyces sp. NPDC047000 TaxID=3155474 RepID=UPI0033D95BC5
MKLAFSTLGVPGLPIPEVVRLAAANGFHGVELRAHPEEPVNPATGAAGRANAVAAFASAGIEIICAAGYTKIAAPGDDALVLAELRALIDLAKDLNAPFARVFPGGDPDRPDESDAIAARRLGTAAEYAAEAGVRILLETHDSHRTGAAAIRILGPVGHGSAGAVWDVMHTWLGGEQPSESYAALAPHLGYVQVKDIASPDDTTPLPLGKGILPLSDCVELLSRHNWDGWLCWEYEKRWYDGIPPLQDLLPEAHTHLSRLLTESA